MALPQVCGVGDEGLSLPRVRGALHIGDGEVRQRSGGPYLRGAVFEELCRAVRKNAPCPSTEDLSGLLKSNCGYVQTAFAELKSRGLIEIVSPPHGIRRQVKILSGPQAGGITAKDNRSYMAPHPNGGELTLDDDLMNYGSGFHSQNVRTRSLGSKPSKPLAHTAGGVGRYL